MAVDVLQGETLGQRSGQWISLFFVPLLTALAAAPYPLHLFDPDPDGYESVPYGYSMELWFVRAFFAALALLALRSALQLRHPVATPVVEVSRDLIRWAHTDGPERVVPRAAVRSLHVDAMYIEFKPALGEKIRELPVASFDHKAIKAALERHHWNVE